nr:DNA helicase [Tanacetum cinerariifolium]
MKTKRKLVPKSYPLIGDANVVSSDVDHRVYDTNLNNTTTISGAAVLNTNIGQPITTFHHSDAVPDTECQISSHSVIPTSISIESLDITKPNADVAYGAKSDSYYSCCSGETTHRFVVSNSNNRPRGRQSFTKHNHPITGGSSSQQPSSSGPPLDYKYLGDCTHTCQHCGALFWLEEHLKSTPTDGEPPRFLQLYIYDTDNEVDNRLSHYIRDNSVLCRDIVERLIDLLDTYNALVQLFRIAREKFQDTHVLNFKAAREYELPTRDMLGIIVYETGPKSDMDYDIVLEERLGHSKCVNKLHLSYMSSQFLLLFIYGEDGYSKDLKMTGSTNSSSEDRCLTMLVYYSNYLYDRANRYNYLSRTGKLFQQYVVTAFCAIKHNRIDYIRKHQNDIRNEYLSGIYNAINQGDNDGSDCGSKLILPQSFTGGPRYMYSLYLDAIAICRGLPHCHTLLWIDESIRVRRDKNIDTYVSAELPSQHIDPQGHRIVSELMMHDPCGLVNPSATCTQNISRCKKDFPKEYCNQTYVDKSGFVHYKRKDTGVTTTRQNVSLDNRYVVSYNKQLLLAFYAHINVEYCSWTMLIKNLFKYISKGTDRVVARIS